MPAFNAITARAQAMASSSAAAASVTPDVLSLKASMIAQIEQQVEKACHYGEMQANCVCNLPAPGPLEQLRYPGRFTLKSEVVEKQSALLKKALESTENELRGRGFTVENSHGTVSDYDASLFVTFGLKW